MSVATAVDAGTPPGESSGAPRAAGLDALASVAAQLASPTSTAGKTSSRSFLDELLGAEPPPRPRPPRGAPPRLAPRRIADPLSATLDPAAGQGIVSERAARDVEVASERRRRPPPIRRSRLGRGVGRHRAPSPREPRTRTPTSAVSLSADVVPPRGPRRRRARGVATRPRDAQPLRLPRGVADRIASPRARDGAAGARPGRSRGGRTRGERGAIVAPVLGARRRALRYVEGFGRWRRVERPRGGGRLARGRVAVSTRPRVLSESSPGPPPFPPARVAAKAAGSAQTADVPSAVLVAPEGRRRAKWGERCAREREKSEQDRSDEN